MNFKDSAEALREGGNVKTMKELANGHRFASRACNYPPFERHPEEKHPPACGGDFGCLLCGTWTTGVISQEAVDEKMGPCPNRAELQGG